MSEQPETPERRHGRYLRYAAEARELAARTTDSVKEHHLRLALSWETMARKLAAHLPDPKPKLLQTVGGAVHRGDDAAHRVPPALGVRTEAVRGRLAQRSNHARQAKAVAQDRGNDSRSMDD